VTQNQSEIHDSPLWLNITAAAEQIAISEPTLAPFMEDMVCQHSSYGSALAALITRNFQNAALATPALVALINESVTQDSALISNSIADLQATLDRDPACKNSVEAFLYYRGFKALQSYRVARYFWNQGRTTLARHIQSLIVETYSMDIHPGARIEGGVFIDHGTGIVIGETAQVERNVSMLHNVTLGGTGKTSGLRHPHICEGVLLGAGCKVLGYITIGRNSKVAAGSIVLEDVPENTTAVGIPARLITKDAFEVPAYEMKQDISG
jgi:serine O-acetyltransferase